MDLKLIKKSKGYIVKLIIKKREKYYKKNKDEILKTKNKWQKSNPNKVRLYDLKKNKRQRGWGIDSINNYFKGSHFHHMHINKNHAIGIYIPMNLHMSMSHRYNNRESMNKINNIAIEWYYEENIMINKINFIMEMI